MRTQVSLRILAYPYFSEHWLNKKNELTGEATFCCVIINVEAIVFLANADRTSFFVVTAWPWEHVFEYLNFLVKLKC